VQPRTLSFIVLFMSFATGCSSSSFKFSKLIPSARKEQWEPEIEQTKADWRTDAGKIGRSNRRAETEDPLDKLLWSDEARQINRNVGFD